MVGARASINHYCNAKNRERHAGERPSPHSLDSFDATRYGDERGRRCNNQHSIPHFCARETFHKKYLIDAIPNYAEHDESDYVAPRRPRTALCKSDCEKKHRGDRDAKTSECKRRENLRCVLDDAEIDGPDGRHQDQQSVSFSECAVLLARSHSLKASYSLRTAANFCRCTSRSPSSPTAQTSRRKESSTCSECSTHFRWVAFQQFTRERISFLA